MIDQQIRENRPIFRFSELFVTFGVQDIGNTDSTSSSGSILSVTATDTSILYDRRHSHRVARPRGITVERGSRGFGLSLIYQGLDKYKEKDTGKNTAD